MSFVGNRFLFVNNYVWRTKIGSHLNHQNNFWFRLKSDFIAEFQKTRRVRNLSLYTKHNRGLNNAVFISTQCHSQVGITKTKCQYFHATALACKKKHERKPVVFRPKARFDKIVSVWKNMTVLELAEALDKTVDEIYEVFLYVDDSEYYDKPWSVIDNLNVINKTVKLTGMRYKINPPAKIEEKSNKDAVKRPPPNPEKLVPRPPVVTIMGHVDHGKTTLLDSLRQSSIVDSEFGGITQHIGAFEVQLPSGEQVTFLDTPGHAAFSAMRARGAHVTDLIVLVVAADDGVLPQTKECIDLARESSVPIIVAINKIDKIDADVPKAKEMLLNAGVQLEDQGGEVQSVEISALKGTNISLLVESLVAQAEVLNLRGDPKGMVEAVVIESQVDIHRGKNATCVIQRGTLRKGAVIVAGKAFAKVRNIFNDLGKPLDKAPPGTAAQVIGWRDLPSAGDEVLEVESERRAHEVVEWRKQKETEEKKKQDFVVIQQKLEEHLKEYREQRSAKLAQGIRYKLWKRGPLEKMFKDDPRPRMSLVLKGDVDGSLEAILDVLESYHSDQCPLDILSYGVGIVTINDVQLAKDFNGSVYTFNTSIHNEAKILARKLGTPICEHNIIYRLIENLKDDISARLPPLPYEEVIGEATVLSEFMVSEGKKKVPVAGCRCTNGSLKKDMKFRVVRTSDVLYEGEIETMRHLKKEVSTINKDVECGLLFPDQNVRFQPGDTIICYRVAEKPQVTDWNPPGF